MQARLRIIVLISGGNVAAPAQFLQGSLDYDPAILQKDGELHRFLHREIGSEESLWIVLYLYEHRDRAWTSDELRSHLRIDPDATASSSTIVNRRIELRLSDLFERGLVQQDAATRSHRFAPSDARFSQYLEQLSVNAADREQALSLIYLRPKTGASAFADAFGSTRPSK